MVMDGQIGKLFQQAQKLQADISKAKEELKGKRVNALVDGGTICVTANGNQEIVDIQIDSSLIHPANVNVIREFLVKGVNQALEKSREMANQEIQKATGGLNIPNIPGLF